MLVNEIPSVIVGDAVAGESAQVRNQLEGLIASVNRSNFDIADLCYLAKRKGYYAQWGYTTFQEYSRTLDIKSRRIQYLVRMAEVMDQVGIPRSQYEPIGIAKLREITSLDPAATWTNPETKNETPMREFIAGFVQQGSDLSLEDVKQHVRTLKGFVGENALTFRNLCMTQLVAEQSWDPAIAKAKNLLGTRGRDDEGIAIEPTDGAAAEVLAVSFLNEPVEGLILEEPDEVEAQELTDASWEEFDS